MQESHGFADFGGSRIGGNSLPKPFKNNQAKGPIVGGFTPFEKYARQKWEYIFPNFRGENFNKMKPSPTVTWNLFVLYFGAKKPSKRRPFHSNQNRDQLCSR